MQEALFLEEELKPENLEVRRFPSSLSPTLRYHRTIFPTRLGMQARSRQKHAASLKAQISQAQRELEEVDEPAKHTCDHCLQSFETFDDLVWHEALDIPPSTPFPPRPSSPDAYTYPPPYNMIAGGADHMDDGGI